MTPLTDQQRQAAVEHAQFLADNARFIDYLFGGGMQWIDQSKAGLQKLFDQGVTISGDCRWSIDWITKWSGWRGFGPYGFEAGSEEMWEVLPHFFDEKNLGVGSLVTYGVNGDDHVCMHVGDLNVFSFGSAFNAHIIPLAEETAAHPGQPVTFLTVGGQG